MRCPTCGAEDKDNWKFCESCGTVLAANAAVNVVETPASAAPSVDLAVMATVSSTAGRCRCGAGPEQRDSLGYCSVCGLKVTAATHIPGPGDHREIILAPNFASVTDRGRRHVTNQDNMAIAAEVIDGKEFRVIVVCDGLSSSCAAEASSEVGARTACDALVAAVKSRSVNLETSMMQAIKIANDAVCAVPFTPDPVKDGPATTIVAAVVMDGSVTIGWVGDSRAYLFGPSGAQMLSHDHSWVNEMVDSGEMSEEDAENSPEAHVITQCLGPSLNDDGSPGDPPIPTTRTSKLSETYTLLLCSDGLWNYVSKPEDILARIKDLNAGQDAAAIARSLVQFANNCGGKDNITAAALCVGAAG